MLSALALPWVAILVLKATPFQVALIGSADLLAGLVFGLLAGAWIDRLRRRPILVASDLARALLLASVPGAAALGLLHLGHLFVVAFAMGALTTVFELTSHSFLPSLVPDDALVAANGRLSAGAAIAEAGGFAVSGWLVALVTAPLALLVDASSYLASAVFLARIEVPEAPRPPASSTRSLRQEVIAGVRVVLRESRLRSLGSSLLCVRLAGGLSGAAYLIHFTRDLEFETGLLGMIVALGGLGSLAGALAARPLALRLGSVPAMALGLAFTAAGLALLPLASAPNVIGALLLAGHQLMSDSGQTVFEVNQMALRQAVAPRDALGRVNASLHVAGIGAALAGRLAGGALGEPLGLRVVLAASAGAAGLGAILTLRSPSAGVRADADPTLNDG
jgi:MFS family permease